VRTDDAIRALCERVLAENWREGALPDGSRFGYTSPNPHHYPWQWYWDSCFAAIARRHFDPARSRHELESLLTAATPDGFIGHTIFWDLPLVGARRYFYNVTGPQAAMTASIQPPLLAWAWSIAVGDPAQEPRLARHLDWFAANRDLEGDGLIWIVQPDESGLDASPQFDPVWRWRAHDLPGFLALVRHNRRLRYDLRAVAQSGWPVMCELVTNVLYSLSRTALGRPSLTAALIERCYDERSGLFRPLTRPAVNGHIPVTWAALAPLALPDLPEEIGRRLVEEHLLDPARFWLPAGVPSVAADEKSFQRGDRGRFSRHRYWRGPVWVNTAWLIWLGLVRLGYDEHAQELSERIRGLVHTAGLREYYDPYDGSGMGQTDFAWSTLVMEMLGDPVASR
jgi:hypothetical protein